MMRSRNLALSFMVLLALACTAKYAQIPSGNLAGSNRKATQLSVQRSTFDEPRVEMAKTLPPRFSLTLSREMPTPGWSFTVDSLEVDPEARRIVARVTEHRPGGMVAQVITRTWLRLDLGVMNPGRYFLELYLRDDPDGKHVPSQAVVLEAS